MRARRRREKEGGSEGMEASAILSTMKNKEKTLFLVLTLPPAHSVSSGKA